MDKKRRTIFYFLSLMILLWSHETKGQGPPIFTDSPIMLGLDGGGIRTGHYVSKENSKVYIHPIIVPYNITSKWQMVVIAPFVNKTPEESENRFGFGDLKLYAKYQVHQKDSKGKTFRTLIKLTESFPTGNTSNNPAIGSRAYQTAIALVTGYITTKYSIYGELAYNVTSNGLPDNLLYNLALVIRYYHKNIPPNNLIYFWN